MYRMYLHVFACICVPAINLKKVFSICRDKVCSINGAPVGRILDESMRQERAMLAQTETKSKASLGGRNGRTDKSEGPDPKYDHQWFGVYLIHT